MEWNERNKQCQQRTPLICDLEALTAFAIFLMSELDNYDDNRTINLTRLFSRSGLDVLNNFKNKLLQSRRNCSDRLS